MTFVARVSGGTGGGSKRSLLAKHPEWECRCGPRPGWLVNCKDCKGMRPT